MPPRRPAPVPHRRAAAAAVAPLTGVVLFAAAAVSPAAAWAQAFSDQPQAPQEMTAAGFQSDRPRVERPRFQVAVGMGVSFDNTGFSGGAAGRIPTFIGILGAGTGRLGFELGLFATSANGRYRNQDPVDRLAADAAAVWRPLAARSDQPAPARFGERMLASLALELGLGLERDGRTQGAGSRAGLHTGTHLALPLTPAGSATQVRARLGLRRFFGLYTPQVGDTLVDDSTELYAALATEF